MSHELRTPLSAILGMTERLLTGKSFRETETHRLLWIIKQSWNQLLALIGGILDLMKIEEWKLELEKTTFNLAMLIQDTIDILELSAKDKQISLKYIIDKQLPEYVIWDPLRLRQILINLINNAIKFTKEWWVLLTCLKTNDWIYFEVLDSGIWIAVTNQKKFLSSIRKQIQVLQENIDEPDWVYQFRNK